MACACKVNRDINYLQKHYGVGKGKEQKVTDIRILVSNILKHFVASCLVVICSPFMLLSVIAHTIFFKNKPIRIDKLVKFGHVRK